MNIDMHPLTIKIEAVKKSYDKLFTANPESLIALLFHFDTLLNEVISTDKLSFLNKSKKYKKDSN